MNWKLPGVIVLWKQVQVCRGQSAGEGGREGGVMESSRCEPVPAVWTKRCQFGSHGHCWLADTPHKLLLSLLSSWVSISEGQRVGWGGG